ncbi:hypothetical protein [Rhizobium laguerreae]|uniref:hypothetical protein n=1 Tax=Rhizobium laguerreae TaxID=1076926 RepID=UPI001C8FB2B6|nr:hypothetical protein [Rhizobium laguerreae]MBY3252591.1 hypothetical protein [Rhizobium laguerreae]
MSAEIMPLEFDLVAQDPTKFRSLAEKEWETARGRRNRIAIGDPSCVREERPDDNSLLLATDLENYGDADVEFWRISFSVTLLPDPGCRFRSVDTKLELMNEDGRLPLFVRLKPVEQSTTRAIKVTHGSNAKLGVAGPVLKILNAELGEKIDVETQVERADVILASFGNGTRSAGWRLRISEARDLPLDTGALNVLVAVPQGRTCALRFRVAAEIDIQMTVDRILTQLFVRESQPGASGDYQFP